MPQFWQNHFSNEIPLSRNYALSANLTTILRVGSLGGLKATLSDRWLSLNARQRYRVTTPIT